MSTDDVNSLIRGLENLNINREKKSPKLEKKSPKSKKSIVKSGIIMSAKISKKIIFFIANIIITVLNESSIHLSNNFIKYILLVTTLSYTYITNIVINAGTYTANDLKIIINRFLESITKLFEIPIKNIENYSTDIERCYTSAGTESSLSYIGLGSRRNKNTEQLRSLKTSLESANVNIARELYKLKNDIEYRYVNNILLSFSIIKNEIENLPKTIMHSLKKYLRNATKNAKINVEILELLETNKEIPGNQVDERMSIGYKEEPIDERNNMMSISYNTNSYNPIVEYKKPKNIQKISNAFEIQEVDITSLINMFTIESNIPFDDNTIFDEDSICGRTSRRMLDDFKITTTNQLSSISILAHEKLAENKIYLRENYEYIQLILVITLIIVFSLLLNKGLRTLLSCCARKDGKRSSRRRKTSKRKSMKRKTSKRKSMKRKTSKRKSMKRKTSKRK